MANLKKMAGNAFGEAKHAAVKGLAKLDTEEMKTKAAKTGENLSTKAKEMKQAAVIAKEDIQDKLTELDRMLEQSITEYNDAYTLMSDKGLQLYIERCRSADSIGFVELLVNSIANHPKSFDADFEEINAERNRFAGSCDFANQELQAAREAAGGAGLGMAAGATVAFMAPTAAMWVATTFGTASTGAAISTLSGAAATNAALAWLGGGALAAGGGGMSAGNALLALAGPVGWTIAGATLLTSIVLFANKKVKLNKQKNEEIDEVKKNIEAVRELDLAIGGLLERTQELRSGLNAGFKQNMILFGADYAVLDSDQKTGLGALVNTTKAVSALLNHTLSLGVTGNAAE